MGRKSWIRFAPAILGLKVMKVELSPLKKDFITEILGVYQPNLPNYIPTFYEEGHCKPIWVWGFIDC